MVMAVAAIVEAMAEGMVLAIVPRTDQASLWARQQVMVMRRATATSTGININTATITVTAVRKAIDTQPTLAIIVSTAMTSI